MGRFAAEPLAPLTFTLAVKIPMMRSVYIDESGYTGMDLLSQEQAFQGASAIYISDSEARELIKKHFPNIKSNELKYQRLARRSSNWDRLLYLQKDILDNFISISYVCDKKYLLILHFLNYAVEPFYYERNINFYEDGCNYTLASLLYYIADALLKGNNFKEISSLFQYAVKSKTEISISALVEKIKTTRWKELPEVFGPLALENNSCIGAIRNKDVSTDGAYVVLLSLISRIESLISQNYAIIHDKSKNLEQYDKALGKMIKHKNEISFKETELTTVRFPLKLSDVSQIDSKDSPGIQLADILIGGIMDSS